MSGRFWPICEPAQADYEQLLIKNPASAFAIGVKTAIRQVKA